MKPIAISFSFLLCGVWALCSAVQPVAPYVQPKDNDVRDVVIDHVHDGDTVTCSVNMGDLGGASVWVKGVRLRLKDVSCYEIAADPSKQDVKDREVAIVEREALAKMLLGAKTVTARIYRHGTYDRHDAVLYTDSMNVNSAMLAYPQGGRGVK